MQDFRIVNDQLYYKNWEWYCVGNTNTVERVHCSAFSSDTPPSSPPITPTPLRDTCNPGEFRAPSGRICIIVHSTGDT
ncbi:hypothetical protein KC711_01250 [Candidatus Peregrinibacteria bacterium]|nr:hypothetical protein [Candidatus Peregrinibacteria bacterium]MCB9804269.1 hypothetical protein [Candidatus Peribacteria bacterium]